MVPLVKSDQSLIPPSGIRRSSVSFEICGTRLGKKASGVEHVLGPEISLRPLVSGAKFNSQEISDLPEHAVFDKPD